MNDKDFARLEAKIDFLYLVALMTSAGYSKKKAIEELENLNAIFR